MMRVTWRNAETGVFSKAHNDIAWLRAHGLGNVPNFTGTSIFDPVLCELVYRWFSPEGAEILDPFAGGSVRGVVAGRLGRSYFGVDLRQVQVDANVEQRERICPEADVQWVTGDARDLQKLLPKKRKFDLVFTCPPYFDLEQYSEDPKDLSAAKDYASFHGALEEIMANAVARLRENRFVVLVLGEIRNKRTGYYRGLIGDAERMMEKLGCHFYNEAVLVAPVGSLPVRAGRQFAGLRKLGKCHQNVLVFYKGESVEAIREMGPTEWGQIETNPEVTEEPVSDEAFVEGEE